MIESFKGEKAFFLGNGIHRTGINTGISWGELLERIARTFGIYTDLKNDLKPFPLAFEEMLYAKVGRNNLESKLRNLKTSISEILTEDAGGLIDNEIHRGFMQSGVREIITTNYDYNLETSVIPDFISDKINYSINNLESKHSLYRGYNIDGVLVRHIHGELKHNRNITPNDFNYAEETIMIGFEHYSEYFLKIQSVVKGESGRQSEQEKKSLIIRIRDQQTGKMWTDLFFTHHLIFAGFSLDFSENHLWWLLLQREELKRKSNKYDVLINNEITFCIPKLPDSAFNYSEPGEAAFDKLYKKKLGLQKNKGVADVLSSLGINIHTITCDSYKDFYMKVIARYSNQ